MFPKNESALNILVYFLGQLQASTASRIYPKMFSTDFIFKQQENFVDNQKCQAGFRPLCNKILFTPLNTFKNLKKKCKNVNFSSSDDNDETLGDDDAIDQADVVDPEAGANQNNDNNPTTNLQTLDTANANSIDFRNVTDNDNNIPVSGYILFLFQFLI